jgi:hypothetical protein
MQVRITSVYPPAIVSWGNEKRFMAGTIESIAVNGIKVADPYSFDASNIDKKDIMHVSILERFKQKTKKYKVPGRPYEITIDGEELSCSCPGYKYQRKCKHLTAFKAGELPEYKTLQEIYP